jgi:hypothetical protein
MKPVQLLYRVKSVFALIVIPGLTYACPVLDTGESRVE